MRDIFDDARETLAEITERRPLQTHYDGCRRDHTGCLIAAMIQEIERLRLTDAERFVLREVRDRYADEDDVKCNEIAAVIDRLLDRMQNST